MWHWRLASKHDALNWVLNWSYQNRSPLSCFKRQAKPCTSKHKNQSMLSGCAQQKIQEEYFTNKSGQWYLHEIFKHFDFLAALRRLTFKRVTVVGFGRTGKLRQRWTTPVIWEDKSSVCLSKSSLLTFCENRTAQWGVRGQHHGTGTEGALPFSASAAGEQQ